MAEKKKDTNYRDFNNRIAYNGLDLLDGEILVPVVLNDEMKETLAPAGLNYDFAETWHMPRASRPIPVVFVPERANPEDIIKAIKVFNIDVKRYLTHYDEKSCGDVSLDKLMDDIYGEDGKGYDPTGSTQNEDAAFFLSVLEMLIDELSELDERMGEIIRLLMDGYLKKEILEMVDLGKGQSQGYAFIEKTQETAHKLYNDKYRD